MKEESEVEGMAGAAAADGASSCVGSQSWQNLLLPMFFDVSAAEDESIVGEISQPTGIESSVRMALNTASAIRNSQPQFLYCRDEMKELLKLLYRDSRMSLRAPVDTDQKVECGGGEDSEGGDEDRKRNLLQSILCRVWEMRDDNPLWVRDDTAWSCRECFVQFSVFQRKHVSHLSTYLLFSFAIDSNS